MKEKTALVKYYETDDLNDLKSEEKSLLLEAFEALHNAYVPYSGFRVGAAMLTNSGRIFTGANMENAAYPLCICAEGALLTSYSTSGEASPIRLIAIRTRYSKKQTMQPGAPCGACRQMLHEAELRQEQPITLLLQGEEGPIQVIEGMNNLLPLAFTPSHLASD